ncbi:hypothetical protein K438DRAFT_1876563 [Neofusicoccum parvum]|uniref:Uncharacterized protein n=1 Tax=Neofusicoccum parvum TaxID=310453 RepID=A0ACB5S3T9_9PEZI|nr:hypothetical protein K438DRAFT_1876563 [Neofusicoccum parvum]
MVDLREMDVDMTPLYRAAFRGLVEVVEILIEHGADINLPGGLFGTPYQAAFKQGHVEVLRILAENGAKPCMVLRDNHEQAAWFWEHGGQFSFQAPTGAWRSASLPIQSKTATRRPRVHRRRAMRYWHHGYRFSLPAPSGAWIIA